MDFSRCRLVPVPQDDGTVLQMPPFQHVREGVEWLVNKPEPYALLGNDMGGSKSAQAIIAAQFLFLAGKIDRFIVIAPAAVRPRVWYDQELGQLGEHLMDDVPALVSEYHAKIKQWRRGPAADRVLKIICTNYEWIRKDDSLSELLHYCGPRTLLILDESSAVKNYQSAQTEACMALRWASSPKGAVLYGVPRCGYCWLLNGTPLADGPEDLFSQGNLLHPSIHSCRYITHFRNRFAALEPVRYKSGHVMLNPRSGKPIEHVASWPGLPALLAGFAPHVLRQDWRKNADIPEAMPTEILTVRLTEKTWRAYRNMRDDMVHWLESGDVTVSRQAAVKVLRLAQITSGILGGIEAGEPEDAAIDAALLSSLDLRLHKGGDVIDLPGSFLDGVVLQEGGAEALNAQHEYFHSLESNPRVARNSEGLAVQFIGREKLDFLLEWQAARLAENPQLKLLVWARYVPELRRYLSEAQERFGHEAGAVCGQSIFGTPVRKEREHAERLLHPKTSPPGPLTVGGTYGSGGLGLNFTAFHVVFNLSQVYEDWKRRQADKRVDRPGQRETVVQFDLVAEGPKGQKTIDHVILAARKAKQDLNEWGAAQWVRALREE